MSNNKQTNISTQGATNQQATGNTSSNPNQKKKKYRGKNKKQQGGQQAKPQVQPVTVTNHAQPPIVKPWNLPSDSGPLIELVETLQKKIEQIQTPVTTPDVSTSSDSLKEPNEAPYEKAEPKSWLNSDQARKARGEHTFECVQFAALLGTSIEDVTSKYLDNDMESLLDAVRVKYGYFYKYHKYPSYLKTYIKKRYPKAGQLAVTYMKSYNNVDKNGAKFCAKVSIPCKEGDTPKAPGRHGRVAAIRKAAFATLIDRMNNNSVVIGNIGCDKQAYYFLSRYRQETGDYRFRMKLLPFDSRSEADSDLIKQHQDSDDILTEDVPTVTYCWERYSPKTIQMWKESGVPGYFALENLSSHPNDLCRISDISIHYNFPNFKAISHGKDSIYTDACASEIFSPTRSFRATRIKKWDTMEFMYCTQEGAIEHEEKYICPPYQLTVLRISLKDHDALYKEEHYYRGLIPGFLWLKNKMMPPQLPACYVWSPALLVTRGIQQMQSNLAFNTIKDRIMKDTDFIEIAETSGIRNLLKCAAYGTHTYSVYADILDRKFETAPFIAHQKKGVKVVEDIESGLQPEPGTLRKLSLFGCCLIFGVIMLILLSFLVLFWAWSIHEYQVWCNERPPPIPIVKYQSKYLDRLHNKMWGKCVHQELTNCDLHLYQQGMKEPRIVCEIGSMTRVRDFFFRTNEMVTEIVDMAPPAISTLTNTPQEDIEIMFGIVRLFTVIVIPVIEESAKRMFTPFAVIFGIFEDILYGYYIPIHTVIHCLLMCLSLPKACVVHSILNLLAWIFGFHNFGQGYWILLIYSGAYVLKWVKSMYNFELEEPKRDYPQPLYHRFLHAHHYLESAFMQKEEFQEGSIYARHIPSNTNKLHDLSILPIEPIHDIPVMVNNPRTPDTGMYVVCGNTTIPHMPLGSELARQALYSRTIAKSAADCSCFKTHVQHKVTTKTDFKNLLLNDSPCSYAQAWKTAWTIVSPFFLSVIGTIDKLMTTQEYIDSVPGLKGLSYIREVEQYVDDAKQVLVAMMKKNECIYPKITADQLWLKPRIFYKFPAALNCILMPYAKAFEHAWKRFDKILKVGTELFRIENACGKNPVELSLWMEKAWQYNGHSIIVCGDDSVIVIYYQGQRLSIMLDYKAFDRSINVHAHLYFWALFQELGLPPEAVADYWKVMSSKMVFRDGKSSCKVNIEQMFQPSGDFKTNLTDGVVNVGMLVSVIVLLIDEQADILSNPDMLGLTLTRLFGIKASANSYSFTPYGCEFLKGLYYHGTLDGVERPLWAPFPSQILSKAPTCKRPPSFFAKQLLEIHPELNKREVENHSSSLMCKILSFYCGSHIPNIPIIKEYLSKMRSISLPWDIEEDTYYSLLLKAEEPFIDRRIHKSMLFDYDKNMELIMFRYAITKESIESLISTISKIANIGDFFCHPCAQRIVYMDHIM